MGRNELLSSGEKGLLSFLTSRGAPLRRCWRIRPSRVDRPNWKAECAETCLLRLEWGKGCKALPIATYTPLQRAALLQMA